MGHSKACYFHGYSKNPKSNCIVVSPHPPSAVNDQGIPLNFKQPWKGLATLYELGPHGKAKKPRVDYQFEVGDRIPNRVINYSKLVRDPITNKPLLDEDGYPWLFWASKPRVEALGTRVH